MKERTRRILGDVAIVELIIITLKVVLLYVLEPTTYDTIYVVQIVFAIVSGVAVWPTLSISGQSYDKKEKQEKEKQEKKQRQKESKEFVKNNIPIEKWIQVVPKEKNDDFLLEIIDIANIYAYREDETSQVKIYLEFHYEEEKRFYERIEKRRFTKYYEIK